jgi:hypothetical protein
MPRDLETFRWHGRRARSQRRQHGQEARATGRPLRNPKRRGTIYVVALGVGLLVAVISLGALSAVRSFSRAWDRNNDMFEARTYALSATEVGRRLIAADPNWRTDYTNGAWVTNQPLGSGLFSLKVLNPNGALSNVDDDPVNLTGIGVKGLATQMITVTLIANTTPLSCLGVGLDAAGATSFNSATVQGTSTISCAATITATGTAFNGNNLEALAIVPVSCTGLGTQTILSAARAVPAATAFSYYTSHGTAIPFASLSGGGTLQNVLLSPANNPFGQPDPQGIYVIDCANQAIHVKNMRLFGTLVLLNVPSGSTVEQSINMAPAVANYPTLMVNGAIQFVQTNAPLSESNLGVNFNPSGTPYGGVSNSTTTDTYPSQILGLTYVSGNLSCNGNAVLRGNLVVGGTLTVQSTLSTSYDPTWYRKPPPGFYVQPPPMIVSPGTWAQATN